MSEFWHYTFDDTPAFTEVFDELPLWSAPFGLFLLKHVPLKPNMTVLDIGSGAGFPLLELAERLGPGSRCYGLDVWTNANNRANKKIGQYGASHVQVIEGSAETLPFDADSLDLIVSNLGINNFEQPQKVFAECFRTLKPGGKLALTTNIDGHWREFYQVFESTLSRFQLTDSIAKLATQQRHRGNNESISTLFWESGFSIEKSLNDHFEMRFLNGTAFLNHHFVKLGWLESWKKIVPESEWAAVFPQLEQDLNHYAEEYGGLTLTVPMLYVEGAK